VQAPDELSYERDLAEAQFRGDTGALAMFKNPNKMVSNPARYVLDSGELAKGCFPSFDVRDT
jgi:hypothetical protein